MGKLSTWFQGIQWANLIALATQFIGILPPSVQGNKYLLIAQAVLAAILPSLGGIAHQVAYSEPQNPAQR